MSIFSQQLEGLQFHLQHIAKLADIQQQERFAHVEGDMVDMMLDQAARFSEEFLIDLAASGDLAGCQLHNGKVSLPEGSTEVYQQWFELGFPTLGLPMEFDGLGFPRVVQSAIQEISDGANLAFGMLTINVHCASLALIKHAPSSLLERWLPGLISGDVAPTIAISEPQAGSDVGRIRVTATPAQKEGTDDEDIWLINGTKIWISYADHDVTDQIIHLVLARVPSVDAIGTRSLGLFAVPKYNDDIIEDDARNGVSPMRLEHKMGMHASPTCVLEFDNAKGYLIGEPGQGIQQLFVMMNAMRLAVSVQGSAAANAATLHAIAYAKERPQGGKPDSTPLMISEHQDVKRMLLEMSAQSEMLRALSLRTAAYLDMAEASTEHETAEKNRRLGELLLPLAKTIGAESAFETVNQGIQVLGGYGYTSDYPLERILRDIRVASIYEGTSGIQALDFMRRKVIADQAVTLRSLLCEIQNELDAQSNPEQNPLHFPLRNSLKLFEDTLTTLLSKSSVDKYCVDAGAYGFLRFAGLLVCAWNGCSLYQAANTNVDYQNRLKAALTLFSESLESESRLWASKSLQPPIDYTF